MMRVVRRLLFLNNHWLGRVYEDVFFVKGYDRTDHDITPMMLSLFSFFFFPCCGLTVFVLYYI